MSVAGKQFILEADREGRRYDNLSDLTFSQDGRHVAYRAGKSRRNNEYIIVVDEKEIPAFPLYSVVGPPVLSPDGQQVAYWASRPDGGNVLVANGREAQPVDRIFDGTIHFSADGQSVEYFAHTGNELWRFVAQVR